MQTIQVKENVYIEAMFSRTTFLALTVREKDTTKLNFFHLDPKNQFVLHFLRDSNKLQEYFKVYQLLNGICPPPICYIHIESGKLDSLA